MLRRLLLTSLLCLAGWTGSSNAALLGVCTYPDCGADFAMGATATYTYNGVDGGVLTLSSSDITSVAFLDGQLNAASTAFGNTGWAVTGATGGGEGFSMSLTVDQNGNIIAGANNITMEGRVFKISGGFQDAESYNDTVLDGDLITGGTINELGWNDSSFDFIGFISETSLLTTAGYGTSLAGNFILNGATTIAWDQSWSSDGTLDVVVPVPAAVWLFGSGLIGLAGVARTKRSHT